MQTGILLMTYGSPRDLDDVEAYITRVRGGRVPGPDMLAEFRRRYEGYGNGTTRSFPSWAMCRMSAGCSVKEIRKSNATKSS